MVINEQRLDLVFGALSDATRRGMLAQLSEGETNVSALGAPYDISQPAVSKHLRVLERAGLVEKSRRGREHFVRVKPQPFDEASEWIAYYTRYWKRQFDVVDGYLKSQKGTNS